ncbi:hypothetical protein M6B38_372090 [Iris pallida]|uniref:Secreted protein n=1 Tax=Iris pallida TaxID=29817 RepID=A0AAX6GCV0_IRIPA|nr:hypothetical protein M6B38_372090 [Iris pallida]
MQWVPSLLSFLLYFQFTYTSLTLHTHTHIPHSPSLFSQFTHTHTSTLSHTHTVPLIYTHTLMLSYPLYMQMYDYEYISI